mmetsp:Transcript_25306/g.53871  ORF Transcript_25306/g.53871 Transcript_25306/m.53871 type:complete len:625 (+) Transcript_25306:25-1899(+)
MVGLKQPGPIGYFDALDVPGLRFPLPLGDSEIGRDAFWEKHPCLRRVSRRHALVEVQLCATGPRVFVQDLGSTHGTRMRCGHGFRPFRFYLLAHGQDVALADLWLRLAIAEVTFPQCHAIRQQRDDVDSKVVRGAGHIDRSVSGCDGTTQTLSTDVDTGSAVQGPEQREQESGPNSGARCKVEPSVLSTSHFPASSRPIRVKPVSTIVRAFSGVKAENYFVIDGALRKSGRTGGVLELSDSDSEGQANHVYAEIRGGRHESVEAVCPTDVVATHGNGTQMDHALQRSQSSAPVAPISPVGGGSCLSSPTQSSCDQELGKTTKDAGESPASRIASDCQLSPPTLASSCTVEWEPPSVGGTFPTPLHLLRGPGARSVLEDVGCAPTEELERLLELGAISLDLAYKVQDRWDLLAPNVSMSHCVERLLLKLEAAMSPDEPASKRLRIAATFPSPTSDLRIAGTQDCEHRLFSVQVPGMVVASACTASVLVASSIHPSVEFLRGVCRGIPIVDPLYLDACVMRGAVLPVDGFLLTDVQGEMLWGFSLQDARERAVARGPVLSGRSVSFALDDSELPSALQGLHDVVVEAGASVVPEGGELIVGYRQGFLTPSRLLGIVLTQRLDWACS